MTDIDFARTTNGGRVRLSSIEQALTPATDTDGRWVTPVVTAGGTMANIGPFTSENAATRWVDANLPMRELP